jgi:hypothetical protein
VDATELATLLEGLDLNKLSIYAPFPSPDRSPLASVYTTAPTTPLPSPPPTPRLRLTPPPSPTATPFVTTQERAVQTDSLPPPRPRNPPVQRAPETHLNTFLYYYDHPDQSRPTSIVPVTSTRLYFERSTNKVYEIHIRRSRDGRPHPKS